MKASVAKWQVQKRRPAVPPVPFRSRTLRQASTQPQRQLHQARLRRERPYLRRVAHCTGGEGGGRRARASGRKPQPPARYGQNDPAIAIGRNNWLFAGSLRAGQRAAAVMSLIQSAKLNGHDPYAYLKDVLTRLPTQRASQIGELLPQRWQASQPSHA